MYSVAVNGCDDSSTVEMYLTISEKETIDFLADLVNGASENYCQPTMSIREGGIDD